MTSMIGILSLLSALAATSYALSCTLCVSTSSTCSGSNITCPSGHQCGSLYTETSADGKKTAVLVRSCMHSSQCNVKGSISNEGKTKMAYSCCNTDNCTPAVPALPTEKSNSNGLVCRSCLSADSTWCYTSDTVQCTGTENMCLLQTTKTSGSASLSTAIRGCTTKSTCDIGRQSGSIGGSSTEVKFICTSGSKSVHKVVLTPAIVCLILLKFFF